MTRILRLPALALSLLAASLVVAPSPTHAQTGAADRPLVLAHYYIWFDATSWQRAKIDTPVLGKYASQEARVIKQHVSWAKQSGIDGFLVSWKHTDKNDHRLQLVADEADRQGLKLGIVYQGLDFERKPLPVARIDADLTYFEKTFASQPVFHLFGAKPTIIWSGTWEFSLPEITRVTEAHRSHLQILASEESIDGYTRVANVVDGNAYYWSSVDPITTPRYAAKLNAMGALVHEHGGLWIAPVSPGFDARLVGGTRVIPRRGVDTLKAAWNTAMRSTPDAIGIISWNEFSENTYIEPSQKYGSAALNAIADLTATPGPSGEIDSSAPAGHSTSPSAVIALVFLVVLLAGSFFVIVRRVRRGNSQPAVSPEGSA